MNETASLTKNPLIDLIVSYERVVEDIAGHYAHRFHKDIFGDRDVPTFIEPKIKTFRFWAEVAALRNERSIVGKLSKKLREQIYERSVRLGFTQERADDKPLSRLSASFYQSLIGPRVRFYQYLLQTPEPSEPFKNWVAFLQARFNNSSEYNGSLNEIIRTENSLVRYCEASKEDEPKDENSKKEEPRSIFISPLKTSPSEFFSNYYYRGRGYGREHVTGLCWVEEKPEIRSLKGEPPEDEFDLTKLMPDLPDLPE